MPDNLRLLCYSAIGSAVIVASFFLGRASLEHISASDKTTERLVTNKEVMMESIIEVCLSDIQSLKEAKEADVNSVELCSNRQEGGVTPSIGFIEESVKLLRATSIAVNVLIRPRPGNFVYTASECETIQRDILNAKLAGADGVVFGALTSDGRVDVELMEVVRLLSEGMVLTFHRAFDVCTDDSATALEDVISVGCDRLLTSGRAANVVAGKEALSALVTQAANRIAVIAGCGVTPENVAELTADTGVRGVHAGSAVTTMIDGKVFFNRGSVTAAAAAFSSPDMSQWQCVDRKKVAALVSRAHMGWARRREERYTKAHSPRTAALIAALMTAEANLDPPSVADAVNPDASNAQSDTLQLGSGDGPVSRSSSSSSSGSESGGDPPSIMDGSYICILDTKSK